MTAARVFRRVEGVYRCVATRQIPRWRVLARVTSYDYQILRPSGSRDNKAVLAARGRFSRGYGCAWRHVTRLRVTGFLGFGRGRSWSTSVVLVSSGEACSCIDLRLMSRVCLSLWILDTALSHGGCEMSWSLNPADMHV